MPSSFRSFVGIVSDLSQRTNLNTLLIDIIFFSYLDNNNNNNASGDDMNKQIITFRIYSLCDSENSTFFVVIRRL